MTDAVYRGYTAAELETQYNARAAIPGHRQILARWARQSARLRKQRECRLDLAYGSGAREGIDLFLCGADSRPLLIYFHGGYWQWGDRKDHSFVAEAFLHFGVNVALVGYDLCPLVRIDDIVRQARRACVWLWRQVDHGYNRERLFVCGHSAGGHLAVRALTTDWRQVERDLPPGLVCGGAAISGVYDLEPLCHTGINDALRLDIDGARDAGASRARPNHATPFVFAVGADESDEFRRQSQMMATAWTSARYHEIDGANHFTILDRLVAIDSGFAKLITDSIKAYSDA